MENSTPYSHRSHQVFSQPLVTAMLNTRIWDLSPKLWDQCFQWQHSRLLFMAVALMLVGQTLSLFLETDDHLMPNPVLSALIRDKSPKRIHFWMHDTLFKHTYIQRQEGKWCWVQPGGCMHRWDRCHRLRRDVRGEQEGPGEGASFPITTWKDLQAWKTQERQHNEALVHWLLPHGNWSL